MPTSSSSRATSWSGTARRGRCGCRRAPPTRCVAYDWPGNVRELERLIERAVALAESDVIELDDLPPTSGATTARRSARRSGATTRCARGRSRYARLVLDRCQGNKREACRVLGISYHTLQAYLKNPVPTGLDDTEPCPDPIEGGDDESAVTTCVS